MITCRVESLFCGITYPDRTGFTQWFPSLRSGHRVQALAKSTLDEAVTASLLALCVSGFLIGVGNAISGNATGSAASVSLLMLGWAIFLLWRGMKYRTVPAPTRLLVKQYTASGTAFLGIGGLISAGVAVGLFHW